METHTRRPGIGFGLTVLIAACGAANGELGDYQSLVQGESSLLGYYSFDTATQGSGTIADLELANGPYDAGQYQVDGVNGAFVTGAPDGNATGQYFQNITDATTVYCAPSTTNWPVAGNGTPYSFLSDDTGTVSLWFTHSGDGGQRSPVAVRDGAGTRYSVHVDGPGNTVGLWNNGAFATLSGGAIDIDDGNWHHLAVVFESTSSVRWVLDGTDLGTTTNGLFFADGNVDEMGIGGFAGSGGESWSGNLDEVAFFEDPLSVATIQSQFTAMTAVAGGNQWNVDSSGNWSDAGNWDPAVPNGIAAGALFTDALPLNGPVTATLDVHVTLGALSLQSVQAITIDGAQTLTLDDGGDGAGIGVTAGSHSISADIVLSDSVAASVGAGSSLELSGGLSGGSPLALAGGGTLTVSGDFSGFTGDTNLTGSTLALNPPNDISLSQSIGGSGTLNKQGANKLTLDGTVTHSGGTLIDAGTLQIGSGGPDGSLGSGNVTNNGALIVNRSADLVLGQDIDGTGSLEQAGSASLTLSGANTYTGATTVSGGTLGLTGSLTSDVTVADGAAISGAGSTTGNLTLGSSTGANLIIDPTSFTGLSVADLTLNGVTTLSVPTPPGPGEILAIATYSGMLTDGNAGTLDDSFAAPGFRSVTVTDSPGTLEVELGAVVNTWTGTSSGNWQVAGPDSNWTSSDGFFFPGDEVVFDDGGSVKTVTLAADVSPADVVVSNSSGNDYTFDGSFGIIGSTELYKELGGTLTLLNDNSYTGATTIVAGTVNVGNGGTTGSLGSGAIANDGTLVINRSDDIALNNSISGTGTLVKSGAGTLSLPNGSAPGVIIQDGGLEVTEGTLDLLAHDVFGNGATSQMDLTIEAGALVTNNTGATGGYSAFRNVTLNGGELRATNDFNYFDRFQAYGLKGTVTVGGSTPSQITDVAQANGAISVGDTTGTPTAFDVADVTGDATADLVVSAKLIDGFVDAGGALLVTGITKTGAGTLSLTRVNSYTGTTAVQAGTLVLAEPFLADAGNVELATGAALQLDFVGTDTIDELFIDGVGQASGTWGSLASAATNKTALITGTGLLEVTTTASSYLGWAAGFASLSDTNPDLDFDGGSLTTGVEYVVDGDPTDGTDDAALAPTGTVDGSGNLVFTFRRTDQANDDPNTTIEVEYGSNLSGWTAAEDSDPDVTITVTPDGFGSGVDRVDVTLAPGLASGGALFARLKVTVVTP